MPIHSVAAPGARPRSFLRTRWRLALDNLPLIVLALAVGAAGLAVLSGHWQVRPVDSGSMRPTVQPGDALVTERRPISDLRVGDVIVFHAPNDREQLIAHRVTDLRPVPGGLLISTKGDANSAADLWNPFLLHGPYIYRAQFSLPLVGYVGIAVHSHTAQLLLFSGGGVLALLALIGMFIPNRKQPAEAGEAVA